MYISLLLLKLKGRMSYIFFFYKTVANNMCPLYSWEAPKDKLIERLIYLLTYSPKQ